MNATATRPLAIVTGASSGIGRELAARFAEGGFDLGVAAEDERISSIAATAPRPYHATYAASKAFLLSFSEALRYELRDTGVTVTALMPGPTDTMFFDRAGMQGTRLREQTSKDDLAEVARAGFEALMAGKDHVVAGSAKNKVQAAAGRLLPETAKAKVRRARPSRAAEANRTRGEARREDHRKGNRHGGCGCGRRRAGHRRPAPKPGSSRNRGRGASTA
jgi:short-subunit dehydrogenase